MELKMGKLKTNKVMKTTTKAHQILGGDNQTQPYTYQFLSF